MAMWCVYRKKSLVSNFPIQRGRTNLRILSFVVRGSNSFRRRGLHVPGNSEIESSTTDRCLRLLRFRLFTASLCFFRYHRFPILSTYHMNVPASFAASLPPTSCLPSMLPLTTTAFLAKALRQQWWRRFYCSNPSCIARTAGNSGLERLYRHPIRRFRSLRKTGR